MERLTEIQNLLADPDALTDEQIGELHAELLALFDDVRSGVVDGIAPTDVAVLSQIVEAAQALVALAGQRMEAAEALAAQIAELEASLRVADDTDTETEVDTEADVETGAESEPEAAAEPVAAATRPRPSQIAQAAPARTRPRPAAASLVRITANGIETDWSGVITALTERINSTRGPARSFEKTTVARLFAHYPSELRLTGQDVDGDAARITAQVSEPSRL